MLTNTTATEKFDLNAYLEDKGGRDLTPDDLKYIFEHFVTEATSEERHATMMEAMGKQTAALELIVEIDKRVCVIEEDKKLVKWLVPVLISTCVILLGIAGTAIAYIKLTK